MDYSVLLCLVHSMICDKEADWTDNLIVLFSISHV